MVGLGLGGCATLYILVLMQMGAPENDTAIIGAFNIAGGIGALAMTPLEISRAAYTSDYTGFC